MELKGKSVAMLAEDLYEDLELWYPFYRLKEAGADVVVLGVNHDTRYESKHDYPVKVDRSIDDVSPRDFDAVIIPGGYAPDRMRRHRSLTGFVRAMHDNGKIVAFICHAAWVAISAGIVADRQVTSWPSLRDDVENAGARWVDKEVVRDGGLISSRMLDDLPAFCRAIISSLKEA